MMLWWLNERLHGSALRHFCNAVVWIALVHVKKSWKLVEINLTTLFTLVELIFKNSLT